MSRIAVSFAALVALSACATTTRTTVDYLYVITDPEGSKVSTSAGVGCTSPCTIILPRNAGFDVSITQAGYEPWSGRVTRVRKGANPLTSTPVNAAGGVVAGTTAGLVAVGASGEVGSAFAVPAVTTAGAIIVLASALAGIGVHIAVDATTGADYNFSPNPLVVRLIPVVRQ